MVRRKTILIGDEDPEYVAALVSFLMAREAAGNTSTVIMHYSDESEFEQISGTFDLALLSSGFTRALSNALGRIKVKKLLCLSEEPPENASEDVFYKYQNMDALTSAISAGIRQKALPHAGGVGEKGHITCIYSPGGNDLALTFSLSICKYLSERESVLFVDAQELSLLPALMQREFQADMVDLLYLLENDMMQSAGGNFIVDYEGFFVLAPVGAPSQLSYITPEQWKKLYSYAFKEGYKRLVVLFGNLIQGFDDMAAAADEMIVVNKGGEFGMLSKEVFVSHLDKVCSGMHYIETDIPFSPQNLTKGSYRLDALINGKMLEFVRRELSGKLG